MPHAPGHDRERQAQVTAVISMYSPPDDLPERVAGLMREVEDVIVVDDGSPGGSGPVHDALTELGVRVLALPDNSGIAAALNRGIAEARRNRPEGWVLTLDQDSALVPGYVSAALERFAAADALGLRPAAVAAGTINGVPAPAERTVGGERLAYDPIQSGLLIPPQTLDRLGTFDEGLFIDLVDTEYSLRARAAGLSMVASPASGIVHRLGTPRPMRVGPLTVRVRGRTIDVPHQPPFRVYYMSRNMLAVVRRYARRFPGWLARRAALELAQHCVRVLWGPQRLAVLFALGAGTRDFLRGRRGPIPVGTSTRLTRMLSDGRRRPSA